MKNYKKNAFIETFNSLNKLTGETKCVNVVKEILIKINVQSLNCMFIKETGKLLTDFRTFFKGIENTPKKYWLALFDHFERNVITNPYMRTKNISSSFLEPYRSGKIYINLESHLDCVVHSLVKQLKRELGIFEPYNKLK